MNVVLEEYQSQAVKRMKNGCILCGKTGSGKSITGLAYYYIQQGGCLEPAYIPMKKPKDLYIITTAMKRNSKEWEEELNRFGLSSDTSKNEYDNKIVVNSWNNIMKYADIHDAFFIFDEQRAIGFGAWGKNFIKIAKKNDWILLSATPGDKYEDYGPAFVAHGFYRNASEFRREHLVYSRFSKYPKIEGYMNEALLQAHRDDILIPMKYRPPAIKHDIEIEAYYDVWSYKELMKYRWNKEKEQPIETASELCCELRKIVNLHPTRLAQTIKIVREKKKVIIFYNFDYELLELRKLDYGKEFVIAEWNGHKHELIPDSDNWVYLVQYNAGAEGWNCIKTDTIIFFSQNYSYKVMEQASGRIDRKNTPFKDLYLFHLKSKSPIDLAIAKALRNKKKFNELAFLKM